jgi:hypothetical protein
MKTLLGWAVEAKKLDDGNSRDHTSYLQPSVHHGDFKATRADSLASDVRPTLNEKVKTKISCIQAILQMKYYPTKNMYDNPVAVHWNVIALLFIHHGYIALLVHNTYTNIYLLGILHHNQMILNSENSWKYLQSYTNIYIY